MFNLQGTRSKGQGARDKERHLRFAVLIAAVFLCLSLALSPTWAQTQRRLNRCRTKEVTQAFLQSQGILLRRSPIKLQTGRTYPRGTIGTGLLPINPLRGKTIRVVHLLANFPIDADHVPQHTPAFFDEILFNENNPESMAAYYKEVSYGQIRVTGKTFGWFNFGAATNNPIGVPRASVEAVIAGGGISGIVNNRLVGFIPDIITQADSVVDYSQFDGDRDSRVDCLIVTVPNLNGYYDLVFGRTTGTPVDPAIADPLLNNLAYRLSLPQNRALGLTNLPTIPTNDNVNVDQWMVCSEDNAGLTTGFNNGVSTYAHEFGHILGLPDLVDQTSALFPRIANGAGWWDGMAWGNRNDPTGFNVSLRPQLQGGIVHPSVWCKFALGWITPTPVSGRLPQVNIPAVETNPIAYRLSANGNSNNPEYFLIENRQNTGRFDSLLRGTTIAAPSPGPAPGTGPSQRFAHGLLIWHIDETVIENSAIGFFIVSDIGHPGIKLMQADGRNDLDNMTVFDIVALPWDLTRFGFGGLLNGNFGDDSDTFPGTAGVTQFTNATNPNSHLYTGFDSGVRVINIAERQSNVVADLIAEDAQTNPVFTAGITVVEPSDGQRTTNSTPTIRAVYSNGRSDLSSSLDPLLTSTIDVVLDGVEVVSNGQVNPQAGTFSFDGTNIVFRPSTSLVAGRHTVVVRGNDQAHGSSTTPTVISNTVNFNLQPSFIANGGLQMISFPFRLTTTAGLQPNNAAQLATLQDLTAAGPQFVLQTPTPRVARFDVSLNSYHIFNPVPPPGGRATDPFVDMFFPGCGYWISVPTEGLTLRVQGEVVPTNQPFQVIHEDSATDGTLPPGFRMIGNPFDFPVDWASVQVGFQGRTFSLQEAIDNNPPLISPTIYTFTGQGYTFAVAPDGQLLPFTGHWIKLLQPVQLFIPPARSGLRNPALASLNRAPKLKRGKVEGWKLQLSATVGENRDAYNFIGAASTAEDGLERSDVVKAPTAPGSRVAFNILPTLGSEATKLAQDLRKGPLTSKQSFNVEVIAGEPYGDVHLTWQNIQEVPKNYAVILRDLETQKQVYLRTSSGYHFNAGASGVRRFQIIVDPSGSKPLNVSVRTSKAQAGIGALFTYTLSKEADVEAVILSPTGQVIRRLNVRNAPAGVNSFSWDTKDSRGRTIGRGTYLLRLRAQTVDQQVGQGVATFTMR